MGRIDAHSTRQASEPGKPPPVPDQVWKPHPYIVKSLVHASDVLNAFHHRGDVLRLRDVMSRTGFSKGMCFRILHTLHRCGFLERPDRMRYRLAYELRIHERHRIGCVEPNSSPSSRSMATVSSPRR